MRNNNNKGSRAAWARGFAALCAALAIGLGAMASPAEAAPFAYVANNESNTVSVIDTASNTVVATIPVGNGPSWVAVTPDGKHAYVTNELSHNVSVIDTATNTVAVTLAVGFDPTGVAVTPDGKYRGSGKNLGALLEARDSTLHPRLPDCYRRGSGSGHHRHPRCGHAIPQPSVLLQQRLTQQMPAMSLPPSSGPDLVAARMSGQAALPRPGRPKLPAYRKEI